jgi:L-malate glycosyltransferase
MKILLLGDANSNHIKRWALSLLANKCELTLFSFQKPIDNWYEQSNVKIHYLNIDKTGTFFSKRVSSLNYLRSVGYVKKLIKKTQPDIVHSHFLTSYGVLGDLTGFKNHIISIWGTDVYHDLSQNTWLRKRMKKALFNAVAVCSTSKNMLKLIPEHGHKTHVIPFGIDTELFKPLLQKATDRKITFGVIKALKDVYGIDILLQAFSQLITIESNASLAIVGDGPNEKMYKDLSKTLKIERNVQFIPRIDNHDVPEMLNNFTIFVNLSRSESFGVSVLEASACGLPVILSNIDGLKEVYIKNETGIAVDLNNIEEIVTAMQNLMKNEKLRLELGEKGRKFVIDNYEINNTTKKMISLYKELL